MSRFSFKCIQVTCHSSTPLLSYSSSEELSSYSITYSRLAGVPAVTGAVASVGDTTICDLLSSQMAASVSADEGMLIKEMEDEFEPESERA